MRRRTSRSWSNLGGLGENEEKILSEQHASHGCKHDTTPADQLLPMFMLADTISLISNHWYYY